MKSFVVSGYGVPKDILKDENYGRYLSAVFNRIYDLAAGERALVIFSGGPADCFRPPFKRTEAAEMVKLFKKLSSRAIVKSATKKWKYVLEKKALSSVENSLYSRRYLKKICPVVFFCEHTRAKRDTIVAKKVFKGFKVAVVSIDFDTSSNRYLDKKFLRRKENKALKVDLAALKDKKFLKEYIDWNKRKLEFFRKNYKKDHAKMVEKWWRQEIK